MIMFVLVAPGIAGAVGWGSAVDGIVRTTGTITTSAGKYLVPVEVALPKTVAKETAKQLIKTGAKRVAVSVLSGPAIAVIGTAWLVYDLLDLETALNSEPGLKNLTKYEQYVPGCATPAQLVVAATDNWTTGTKQVITSWNCTVYAGGTVSFTPATYADVPAPVSTSRVSRQNLDGGCSPSAWTHNFMCSQSFTVNRTSYLPQAALPVTTSSVNDPAVEKWVDNHKEYFEDPKKAVIVVQDDPPVDGDGKVGFPWPDGKTGIKEGYDQDPETGKQTDPKTGEDTSPQTSTTTGIHDQMTVPGQPATGTADTTIEAPEKNSIGTLITGWLASAPFMSIINNLDVDTSSEQCTFTILLPEVLGGSAQLDFCQFSTLWSLISTIVISVAYIYGAMIIFGGKS